MAGVNKAIIIGNLGQDPEIRAGGQGSIASLSIATSDSWTDKTSGEKKEKTEWHRVVAFGKLADIMGSYLVKGSKVFVICRCSMPRAPRVRQHRGPSSRPSSSPSRITSCRPTMTYHSDGALL